MTRFYLKIFSLVLCSFFISYNAYAASCRAENKVVFKKKIKKKKQHEYLLFTKISQKEMSLGDKLCVVSKGCGKVKTLHKKYTVVRVSPRLFKKVKRCDRVIPAKKPHKEAFQKSWFLEYDLLYSFRSSIGYSTFTYDPPLTTPVESLWVSDDVKNTSDFGLGITLKRIFSEKIALAVGGGFNIHDVYSYSSDYNNEYILKSSSGLSVETVFKRNSYYIYSDLLYTLYNIDSFYNIYAGGGLEVNLSNVMITSTLKDLNKELSILNQGKSSLYALTQRLILGAERRTKNYVFGAAFNFKLPITKLSKSEKITSYDDNDKYLAHPPSDDDLKRNLRHEMNRYGLDFKIFVGHDI